MKTTKGTPCQNPLTEIAKDYTATRLSKAYKSKFASHALKSLSARPLSDCLPTALEAATCKLSFSQRLPTRRQRCTAQQLARARAGGKLYPRIDRLKHARAVAELRKLQNGQRFHACPD
jgi:hypothetical protein